MLNDGSIFVELLDSNDKIQGAMYSALVKLINKKIIKNKDKTITAFKQRIRRWVMDQPEIDSLLNAGSHSLHAQFGLHRGSESTIVDNIISAIVDSFAVRIGKINTKFKGKIEFNFQPKNFFNLLSLSGGHVITTKGSDLHWLDWLLMRGDTTIIVGYEYESGSGGRSGGGLMGEGGIWRVPPEFSGTNTNNFVTRAFKLREKEISQVLQGLFV
jgi:hypothetical protein